MSWPLQTRAESEDCDKIYGTLKFWMWTGKWSTVADFLHSNIAILLTNYLLFKCLLRTLTKATFLIYLPRKLHNGSAE